MNIFTYILPTVLHSTRLLPQLSRVLEHPLIGEVILINNSGRTLELQHDKLQQYVSTEPLYCNGSWNYGVLNASNENIILATDDIEYDTSVFDFVSQIDLKPIGPLMYNSSNSTEHDFLDIQPITPDRYIQLHGSGQIMFMHRDNFLKIPDEIKHWYGDALQLHWNIANNRMPHFIIGKFVLTTNLSERDRKSVV